MATKGIDDWPAFDHHSVIIIDAPSHENSNEYPHKPNSVSQKLQSLPNIFGWQYGSTFICFHIVVSEIEGEKFPDNENRF